MNNEQFVTHQSEMARGIVEIKDGATYDAFNDIRRECRIRLKAVEATHAKIIKDAGLALAQAYADEAADSNDLNRLSETLKNMVKKYHVESVKTSMPTDFKISEPESTPAPTKPKPSNKKGGK